jgi:hypothetical protein
VAATTLALLLLGTAPAVAVEGSDYSMEILVDGRPLSEHHARGAIYIEAIRGREYSVRLRNRTSERIAIALAVDGLNSIDAATTPSREAAKWILGPRQTITLDGWQTSSSTARKFFFTTESRSYGAWLGESNDLGNITAVVYRERRPRPTPVWKHNGDRDEHRAREGAARPSSPSSDSRGLAGESGPAPDLSDDYAATGIGREVGHSVRTVPFAAESHPAAILQVRYEFRDALVKLGVLPRPDEPCDGPLQRRERGHGFHDPVFAPDPYRPGCP